MSRFNLVIWPFLNVLQILMHHIRATLPDIKARITQNLQKYNAELVSLGGPTGDGNSGNIILSVITEFTAEFRTTIDGNTNDISLNELSGGARISFVFHELFNNGIKSIDPFDQVKDGDIRTILYNSSVSLFKPYFGSSLTFCRAQHLHFLLAQLRLKLL
jgi:replication fork clamp-binding protein CrfC